MAIARSKLTAQGQTSVPARIRQKLGLKPGSVLEWDEHGEEIVVRRVGPHTFKDAHRAMFPKPPEPKTLEELKEGVPKYIKERHARH